ncbi:hypothetical protein [Dyadobacter flavalbus]|nr:hypothetical protein [Dyadobacter flavalbus]
MKKLEEDIRKRFSEEMTALKDNENTIAEKTGVPLQKLTDIA